MQSDQETYFFSLDFNIAGQSLPPINAAELVMKHPDLAWGVIIFDAFVMNGDRHPANIAYDVSTDKVQIFDHSHAFLSPAGDIKTNLANRENNLAVGSHCLVQEINNTQGMSPWLDRVILIPDYFIDGVISAGCACGIPASEQSFLNDFMKKRRDKLSDLFKANMNSFPKLPKVQP